MVWSIVVLEAVIFTALFAHWKIFRLPRHRTQGICAEVVSR